MESVWAVMWPGIMNVFKGAALFVAILFLRAFIRAAVCFRRPVKAVCDLRKALDS